MGALNPDPAFWAGKSVLLTGHTGFKGAWLSLWLERLGARVTGFGLPPLTRPNLFDRIGFPPENSRIGDIRDPQALADAFAVGQPDIVIHMAARAWCGRPISIRSGRLRSTSWARPTCWRRRVPPATCAPSWW